MKLVIQQPRGDLSKKSWRDDGTRKNGEREGGGGKELAGFQICFRQFEKHNCCFVTISYF